MNPVTTVTYGTVRRNTEKKWILATNNDEWKRFQIRYENVLDFFFFRAFCVIFLFIFCFLSTAFVERHCWAMSMARMLEFAASNSSLRFESKENRWKKKL